VAARSAHELRAFDRRDRYLAEAPEEGPLPVVTKVGFLLDEERSLEALSELERLHPKHTMALKLELRAQQQAQNWERVLVLLHRLDKLKALDAIELTQYRRQAHVENLARKKLDVGELLDYWKKLAKPERRDPQIAAAAAKSFIALGQCDEARETIEDSLNTTWDEALLPLYAECVGDDALARIERAEKWLHSHPDDPELLLTLGKLCAHQGLWGKAQSYFDASLALNGSHAAHLALAKLYERNDPEKARQHYQQGFALALSELKEERRALLPSPRT
jgi:HemY protein